MPINGGGGPVFYFSDDRFQIHFDGQFQGNEGRAYYVDVYDRVVYLLQDGLVRPYMQFDMGEYNITGAEIQEAVELRKTFNGTTQKAHFMTRVHEGSDFVTASIFVKGAESVILANKRSSKSLVYSLPDLSMPPQKPYLFYPYNFLATSGNQFVTIINEFFSINFRQNQMKKSNFQLAPTDPDYKNYQAVMNWKSDDNPIVVIYTLSDQLLQ